MNIKIFLITCFLALSLCVHAQTPGGVVVGTTLWLKANIGVTNTGNNTAVTQWDEQSGAGVTGNFGPHNENSPTYIANGINFNPQISFVSDDNNLLTSNNAIDGAQMIAPYNNTLIQVIKVHTTSYFASGSQGMFFYWEGQTPGPHDESMTCGMNPGSNPGQLRFGFSGATGPNPPWHFSTTNVYDRYYIASISYDPAHASIRLNGATDAIYDNSATAFAPATHPERVGLGLVSTADFAEVIFMNNTMGPADRNKAESYLAVKYGITLSQASVDANNYTSAENTVIWDHYANLGYQYNITGIGRDDASALQQNQSKSINDNTLVTVYHGIYNGTNFPALNTDNKTPFPDDNSFLLFGDNNLDLALNICDTGSPSIKRMARVWKFQGTGTIDTVTLAAPTASLPAHTATLLISTDSTFPLGNTAVYVLDTTNGSLSRSVALPVTGFFTFGTDSLVMRASSNSPICAGETGMLYGTAVTRGTFYQWTGPNSFTSAEKNPLLIAAPVANSGQYVLSGMFEGCPATPDTISVVVKPTPSLLFKISDTVVCLFDTASITYTGDAPDSAQYSWTLPANASLVGGGGQGPLIIRFDSVGVFQIKFNVNDNGCISNDSLDITAIKQQAPIIIYQKDICFGQSAIISFDDTTIASGSDVYRWGWNGGNILTGTGPGPYTVTWNDTGNHIISLSVVAGSCASDTTKDTIGVHPLPGVHIIPPTSNNVCTEDSLLLRTDTIAVPVSVYQWSPSALFGADNDKPAVYAVIDTPGYIYVRAVSNYGCASIDSIFFNTHLCCDLALPNAFTPNNDGKNDMFRVVDLSSQKVVEFLILNRWGGVVYDGTDAKGWDGTYHGTPAPLGTYFYMLTYVCSDGREYHKKGDVTLIR